MSRCACGVFVSVPSLYTTIRPNNGMSVVEFMCIVAFRSISLSRLAVSRKVVCGWWWIVSVFCFRWFVVGRVSVYVCVCL